jgi:hypothetical protein
LYQNPHPTYIKNPQPTSQVATENNFHHLRSAARTQPLNSNVKNQHNNKQPFEKQTVEAKTTTFATTTNLRLASPPSPPSLPPQFKSATTKTTMSHHHHATTTVIPQKLTPIKLIQIYHHEPP